MSKIEIQPTGVERRLGEEEIIVSKTDPVGRLTYVNQPFLTISGYTESEVIGQQHNIVRHPDMPRSVFKLLWDTIQSGQEIFAYVVNLSKNGDHYWVFAHVTPSFSDDGAIVGFHSNRRAPDRMILGTVQDLYKSLLAEERRHSDRRAGMEAAAQLLSRTVTSRASSYDEFICTL